MKYRVRLDGEIVDVELVERNGGVVARIDDREVAVELCPIRGGSAYSLLVGLESLPLVVSGANDDLTLVLGSETWRVAVHDEREAAAAAVGGADRRPAGGTLRSVMPGIVREIRVAPGEVVERGRPLLILEAMKMQNEVRADSDGTVTEVHVAAGVAVAKGDPLVTLRAT